MVKPTSSREKGDHAPDRSRPRASRRNTLAALLGAYFVDLSEAEEVIRQATPETADLKRYRVLRPSSGDPEYRTDVKADQDRLKYESYTPPAIWQAPYSVLRVMLAPREEEESEELQFHGGEELLLPIDGAVMYKSYWTPGGATPKLERLLEPLVPGQMIRINPQLPHQGWLPKGHGESARAWMMFRHRSEMPAAISLNEKLVKKTKLHAHPHRTTIERLTDPESPAHFALVAWGLAETIRLRRLASDLQLYEVAKACGMDRSYLSRLENADVNISLSTLFKLAELLHIDLTERIRESQWCWDIASLEGALPGPTPHSVLCEGGVRQHMLHARHWELTPGPDGKAVSLSNAPFASWLVVHGRAVCDIEHLGDGVAGAMLGSNRPSERSTPELLEAGCVLHLKGASRLSIQALEPTRMVQVEYQHECPAQNPLIQMSRSGMV